MTKFLPISESLQFLFFLHMVCPIAEFYKSGTNSKVIFCKKPARSTSQSVSITLHYFDFFVALVKELNFFYLLINLFLQYWGLNLVPVF
jgi:hypothetical protein